MTGIELIAAERKRQIEQEGWTPEHDDGHFDGELAQAAACYALPKQTRNGYLLNRMVWEFFWPWDSEWWKPATNSRGRIKELTKAGALIAAEIDRLQREKDASV